MPCEPACTHDGGGSWCSDTPGPRSPRASLSLGGLGHSSVWLPPEDPQPSRQGPNRLLSVGAAVRSAPFHHLGGYSLTFSGGNV